MDDRISFFGERLGFGQPDKRFVLDEKQGLRIEFMEPPLAELSKLPNMRRIDREGRSLYDRDSAGDDARPCFHSYLRRSSNPISSRMFGMYFSTFD